MGRTLWLVLLLGLLSACGIRQGFEDNKKAQETLKSQLGLDSQVSFQTYAGTNGNRMTVLVRLRSAPSGDPAALKTRIEDVIAHTYRAHVDEVRVQY